MRKPRHFSDPVAAKRAGRKGGKSVPPSLRYFSVNREAAVAAGRKSRYVAPQAKPVYDDTRAKALFEGILPEYAAELPRWDKLTKSAREFWRKQADVLLKNGVDPSAEVNLLWDTSNLG